LAYSNYDIADEQDAEVVKNRKPGEIMPATN
jgi:hypothetical protein